MKGLMGYSEAFLKHHLFHFEVSWNCGPMNGWLERTNIPRFLQHLRGSFNKNYCLEVDDSFLFKLRCSLMSRKNIFDTWWKGFILAN
jgi:hypothetical protein